MKVLVIPDVHLKYWMFDRAEELLNTISVQKAVCLMDLPDDWNQGYNLDLYEKTLKRAVRFQKAHPDTLWCWGNHDLSYFWGFKETGFSFFALNTVTEGLAKLRLALPDDNQLKYIHRIDNVLFMHGGLTEEFARAVVGYDEEAFLDIDTVISSINELTEHEMWADDSPLWFRPQYNYEIMYGQDNLDGKNILQVVGHTPVEKIEKDRNIISCDIFSTYRDGTPIGTEEFLIIDTETLEYRGINIYDF